MNALSEKDSLFLHFLKGMSILVIVFGHSGGFWAFKPYTEFMHVFVPVFFFISGAVTFYSFNRSKKLGMFYWARIVGLYVPYAMLGGIALGYAVFANNGGPTFEIQSLIEWLKINPSADATPFSVGHVWFLQTLMIITLVSPLYFVLNANHHRILIALMAFMILVSLVQLYINIDDSLIVARLNFYKPLVHSAFYIFGMLFFTRWTGLGKGTLSIGAGLSICMAVLAVMGLGLNPDYELHTFAPDFYYVAGSFAAIFMLVMVRGSIASIIEKSVAVRKATVFVSRNVFAIYLLHPLVIQVFIHLFEGDGGGRVSISMGVIRFATVLAATSLLAVPFTGVTSKLIKVILKK